MKKSFLGIVAIAIVLAGVYFINSSYVDPDFVSPGSGTATTTIEVPPGTGILGDLVKLVRPLDGSTITSPFVVEGFARGNMFFEASFPIKLVDSRGKALVETYAQAQGDWMTSDFVPFKATVAVPASFEGDATLVFSKDNPSGLPEHDASVSIRVRIVHKQSGGTPAKPCVISGCSAQICGETEQVSTCEYREVYACYKSARCERQTNGQCGWTDTPELRSCVAKAQ